MIEAGSIRHEGGEAVDTHNPLTENRSNRGIKVIVDFTTQTEGGMIPGKVLPKIGDSRTDLPGTGGEANIAGSDKVNLTKVVELAPTVQREHEKQERGCVVRGLASALGGVEVKEAEWQERFNQFGDEGPYAGFEDRYPKLTPKQKEFLNGQKIAYADAQVGNLIKQFRQHDSEVGAALRDREVEDYGRQDEAGIRQLIASGRDVTIIGRVEGGGRHMVHVTIDEQGDIVAQSDSGQTVELPGEYNTIAFAAKGEQPIDLKPREHKKSDLPHLNETMKYKAKAA